MGEQSELIIETSFGNSAIEDAVIEKLKDHVQDGYSHTLVYHGATDQPENVEEKVLELLEREKYHIFIRPSCVSLDWNTDLYLISINLYGQDIEHKITFISSQEGKRMDFAILNGIHARAEAIQKEKYKE